MKTMIALVAILVIIPTLVLAGTSNQTQVSAIVGNVGPTVNYVSDIAAQDLVEGGILAVTFEMHVKDTNHVDDIQNTSVNASFIKAGETSRSQSPCSVGSPWLLTNVIANYTCTINMYYYDGAGVWTVYANASDIAGLSDTNSTVTFTVNNLFGMTTNTSSISFGTVNPDQLDVAAIDDPIKMNNTGNQNFTNTNVTAFDLKGVSDNTYMIPAANFTVNINDAANGDVLGNNTNKTVTGATLVRGATSFRNLFFYLEEVPQVIAQTYNTAGLGQWIIRVYN